jgi:hypothetical protein
MLSLSACSPVGDFLASRAVVADLIAQRVCSLGWSISSSAAAALPGRDLLLIAPVSSSTRLVAGLWMSAAGVAGSSGADLAAAAAYTLKTLSATSTRTAISDDAGSVSSDDDEFTTNLRLLTSALE